jgi:hypothetical protein
MNNLTLLTKSAIAFALMAIFLASAAPAFAQAGRSAAPAGTITALQPLTAAEALRLAFMREEEKLARDVYQELYKKWNLTVFKNISESEQAHFDAIGTLLTRYGAQDPAQATPGVFSDPTLISLYNDMIAKGMQSAQDALEVGALIETRDIADLETALQGTAKLDLKRVYTNLLNASFNHLEAFQTMCELVTPAGL